jgi:hypothetical protein
MNLSAPSRPLRTLSTRWVWTLCLTLALRALVPGGTMLDVGTRDGFFPRLVLCPAQNPGLSMGGHHQPMDGGHAHSDDRPQSHAVSSCLLAQHAGGSPLPAAVPVLALAAVGALAPVLPVLAAPAVQRVHGAPLGSRAPPRPFS